MWSRFSPPSKCIPQGHMRRICLQLAVGSSQRRVLYVAYSCAYHTACCCPLICICVFKAVSAVSAKPETRDQWCCIAGTVRKSQATTARYGTRTQQVTREYYAHSAATFPVRYRQRFGGIVKDGPTCCQNAAVGTRQPSRTGNTATVSSSPFKSVEGF